MKEKDYFVWARGEQLYNWGKNLIKLWIGAWSLLVLTIVVTLFIESKGVPYVLTFAVDSEYAFTIPIVLASYLGIFIGAFGPILYLVGLLLIGIGQIVKNTDAPSHSEEDWVCSACGTKNAKSFSVCEK